MSQYCRAEPPSTGDQQEAPEYKPLCQYNRSEQKTSRAFSLYPMRETYTVNTKYVSPLPHLLQFMTTSSGCILFFSMPCLGCSPLPRNRPGGSILKLPMRSLWWSSRQKPNLSTIFWLASFKAYEMNNDKTATIHDYVFEDYQLNMTYQFLILAHVFPGLHLCFMHGVNLSKVTLIKILNQCSFFISHILIRHKTLNIKLEKTLTVYLCTLSLN